MHRGALGSPLSALVTVSNHSTKSGKHSAQNGWIVPKYCTTAQLAGGALRLNSGDETALRGGTGRRCWSRSSTEPNRGGTELNRGGTDLLDSTTVLYNRRGGALRLNSGTLVARPLGTGNHNHRSRLGTNAAAETGNHRPGCSTNAAGETGNHRLGCSTNPAAETGNHRPGCSTNLAAETGNHRP